MENENKLDLTGLNRVQKEAVLYNEGPSLIVAGAGSGKTRVITYKIAYLLEQGYAPQSILALTFSNKAAREMKERISELVGRRSGVRIWMGTFHSIFLRILREYADRIGFPQNFTIYDTTDSRNMIKTCVKELNLDDKLYKPKDVAGRISRAKNNLITASAYQNSAQLMEEDRSNRKPRLGEIYGLYARKCKTAGAMDFDDILLYMNILLRDHPDVCAALADQFRFILVDEYQDTNYAQYLIVKKLSAVHRNVTVVGDDSQSIYAFRGARVENILTFQKDFPTVRTFKLEQNYRSTQTIVDAANAVIEHNSNRIQKVCFSEGNAGEKLELIASFTEQEEGALVASSIKRRILLEKSAYSDFAILYRTNAQSRVIEESLRRANLPYKVYAGHSFYERKEIKEMLAYFKLVMNRQDDEAFRRIVNVPARGIGDTTMERLTQAAVQNQTSLMGALDLSNEQLEVFGLKGGAILKLRDFSAMIRELYEASVGKNAYELALTIANRTAYVLYLKEDKSIEGQSRVENAEELLNSVSLFISDAQESALEEDRELSPEDLSMNAYLSNVSLISDLDVGESEEDENRIKLMTVHSSKGLEFPYVYLVGMEESLFPSTNTLSTEMDIEEERRLFYVGMTRAMTGLGLSYARERFRWGEHTTSTPSRFLKEIPPHFLDKPLAKEAGPALGGMDRSFGRPTGSSFGRPATPSPGPRRLTPVGSRPATASPSARPLAATSQPGPAASGERFIVGERVEHDRFGYGTILSLEGQEPNIKAMVQFESVGVKTLLLKYAKLRKLN